MRLSHWREAWEQNTLRTITSRVRDKTTNTKSKDIYKIHKRGMTRVKTTTRVTKDIRQQSFERGMRDSSLSAVCMSFHFKRCTRPEASSGAQWWVGNWAVVFCFFNDETRALISFSSSLWGCAVALQSGMYELTIFQMAAMCWLYFILLNYTIMCLMCFGGCRSLFGLVLVTLDSSCCSSFLLGFFGPLLPFWLLLTASWGCWNICGLCFIYLFVA